LDVSEITAHHIRAYSLSLQRRDLKDTTQHAHARGIQAWLNWLVREGDLDESPVRKVAMPRLEKRIPAPVVPDDVKRLPDTAQENLDFDRLGSVPEMLALFFGPMTRYGVPPGPVTLMVGPPIASLMGDGASATKRNVRSFLRGPHSWLVDGAACSMMVKDVLITSQAVGATVDYLLSENGAMTPSGRVDFKSEMGVLGIGMNTADLLVARNGSQYSVS